MDEQTAGDRARASGSARRRSARTDEGATLVEFALIAPLLFALILGMIDFGGAYNDWIAMRQGAREGARQAVTGRVGNDTSCSVHPVASTEVHQLVCMVKDRSNLPNDRIRVRLLFEPGEDYGSTRSLKVCTMAEIRSLSGFYSALLDGRSVRTEVQMKVEQRTDDAAIGKGPLTEYSETPFSGDPGDWSFCQAETTS